jgi:hypothetical protein
MIVVHVVGGTKLPIEHVYAFGSPFVVKGTEWHTTEYLGTHAGLLGFWSSYTKVLCRHPQRERMSALILDSDGVSLQVHIVHMNARSIRHLQVNGAVVVQNSKDLRVGCRACREGSDACHGLGLTCRGNSR